MHPFRDDAVERGHHRGARRELLSRIPARLCLGERGLGIGYLFAGVVDFLSRRHPARKQILQSRLVVARQAQASFGAGRFRAL